MCAMVCCGIPPKKSPTEHPGNLRSAFSSEYAMFSFVWTAIDLVPVAVYEETERQKVEDETQQFI